MKKSDVIDITGKTKLIGIIADPIDHVIAPRFANPLFQKFNLDWFLIPLNIKPDNIKSIKNILLNVPNIIGCQLTIPHKELILEYCDELGKYSKISKSVNSIKLFKNRLIGESFDGYALIKSQKKNNINIYGKDVFILGSGGAGRSVAFSYCYEKPNKITLFDKHLDKSQKLCADIKKYFSDIEVDVNSDYKNSDIICNCTPLGLHLNDPEPFDLYQIDLSTIVIDIIAARKTEMAFTAHKIGLQYLDGIGMLEEQILPLSQFLKNESY